MGTKKPIAACPKRDFTCEEVDMSWSKEGGKRNEIHIEVEGKIRVEGKSRDGD